MISEPKSITVIQSRRQSSGAEEINLQPEGYHVWTRGKSGGKTIDEFDKVESIAGALQANRDWAQLRELATSSDLELIASNTTAAGLVAEQSDANVDFSVDCPSSFPGKLTALLYVRFQKGLNGITMLPMELVDNNADLLKQLVMEQTKAWDETDSDEFRSWLRDGNRWLNNLVDRIVVSPSDKAPWMGEDRLAVVGEPFRMLAIKNDGKGSAPIPDDPMVIWTDDLAPYFLRKVRILNGLHTAMVAKFLPQGIQTVLEAVSQPESRRWIDELLNEEILPALSAIGIEEQAFAADVMERFENPFFEHKLADIANGHETKLKVRIQPTFDDFVNAFHKPPQKLGEVLEISLAGVV